MSTDRILSGKNGPIGSLIFNNPEKRNAFSLEMSLAAVGVLEDFAADEAIRVIVLSGAGDKAFVSGADISKFEQSRATKEDVANLYSAFIRSEGGAIAVRSPFMA